MKYTDFYKARDLITKIISEDLLGPVEENEILKESPVSYYLTGKIYPRNIAKIEDERIQIDEKIFSEEELIALGNEGYPSVMGLSFAIDKTSTDFYVRTKLAYYESQENKESNTYLWTRKTVEKDFNINIEELKSQKTLKQEIRDNLFLHISIYNNEQLKNYKLTAAIVNDNISTNKSYTELSKHTYFQPELEIFNPKNGNFCELFYKSDSVDDPETIELELLYSDIKNYAIGHGCAANWDIASDKIVSKIYINVIPEHTILQMKPSNHITGDFLSMKFLAEANYQQIADGIKKLCNNYRNWIDTLKSDIKKLDESLKSCAENNIKKCEKALARLEESINVLKNDKALQAFKYANEAMFLQRKTTEKEVEAGSIAWYPFQLAFILIQLASIVDPASSKRNIVDLLWFPTGGGKTEAYLGIAAFTIFYRRLREQAKNKEDIGVVVFMRYTLRLLSFQQFERASAMICAAEVIRRKEKLGVNPFGIGLWAGQSLTPNELKEAEDYLNGKTASIANPMQVKKCPYCSTALNDGNYEVLRKQKRMLIKCGNSKCEFHDGLPIHLIDEDIYAHKPSFIIGTVDKFARIAFKQEAGELLGIDLECPPELIIQDELHLISGPLGTIAGIYEAAITKLCERNGIKPKVIASTATIRNADNQITSLYGMNYEQFPPQGLTIKDSYFAELASREEKAERDYLGVFSPGTSVAQAYTRVTASLLFASRYLIDSGYPDEVIDSFWTQTNYFNTLRELGSALARLVDSVQDRFKFLKSTKFAKKYPIKTNELSYNNIYEMTSRHSSVDLGNAIQNIFSIPYKTPLSNKEIPCDFLIASNMISVGIDIPRLNNMVVIGQPLKTSEYIQSTSRVGRKTPGLIYVLYHPTGSRDRSHYEQFKQYHHSLYKYVEATSLTPFADRARDRCLQALYVILCRYLIPSLRKNEDAKNFDKNLPELENIRNYIYEYVRLVDPQEELNVKNEIEEIESLWHDKASYASEFSYYSYSEKDNTLYKKDINEGARFRMMNSMRSVEPTVLIETDE